MEHFSKPEDALVGTVCLRHTDAAALHLDDVTAILPLHRKREGLVNIVERNGADTFPVLINESGGSSRSAAENKHTGYGGDE